MSLRSDIEAKLAKYSRESSAGIVETQPSKLRRGEGTLAEVFVIKIDVVESTRIMQRLPHDLYLKVSHTLLSTLDDIVRTYGADTQQTEYAGDGIWAYFDPTSNADVRLISCSTACRYAVERIKDIDKRLNAINFSTRIIVHHGEFVIGSIGPWGDNRRKVMGVELHRIAHLEKSVGRSQIHVTTSAAGCMGREVVTKYLVPQYKKETQQVPDALGAALRSPPWLLTGNPLTDSLMGNSGPAQTITRDVLDHYLVRWPAVYKELGLT